MTPRREAGTNPSGDTGELFPRRAHIYWVRVPDEPGGKRRPALVVSPDSRNRLATDVIVVPISSLLRDAPTHVRLRAGEGGLARASMAKCEQVTTVRRDRLVLRALGGAVAGARMTEIEKAVLRAIGVPIS
jgi:mRNA-degrading endonuclease toxin of MazEF toxin-antitoxin module